MLDVALERAVGALSYFKFNVTNDFKYSIWDEIVVGRSSRMKKFSVNCDFGGQMAPFTIYVGEPEAKHHPLHFQADWLSKNRGGNIPAEVMEAITKLQELAVKNGVRLEELCVYALGSAQEDAGKSSEENTEVNDEFEEMESSYDEEAVADEEELEDDE